LLGIDEIGLTQELILVTPFAVARGGGETTGT